MCMALYRQGAFGNERASRVWKGEKVHILAFISFRILVFSSLLMLNTLVLPAESGRIKLATTTSTENSGLLSLLIPRFEERTGLRVDVIAAGTGKALRLGETGDVDLVLVHARAAEDRFVEQGFGVERRDVMHNDFVLIGPPGDPAGIAGLSSAREALIRIAGSGSPFISRGDDSGTHKLELALWQTTGQSPQGLWYREVGQGMAAVIIMADQLNAYTLADRGTYLSLRDRIDLTVLYQGDAALYNPYGIIAVNPERQAHVNFKAAMEFITWITSSEAQDLIGSFKRDGELLFYPDALE